MKAVDLRNATFESIRRHLTDDRLAVYTAWVVHGPGTTRQVAEKSGIDLLTFRPRTTDLYQIGLVELTGDEVAREGIYAAVSPDRWEAWRNGVVSNQLQLI